MNDALFFHAFAACPVVGPTTFNTLLKRFGSARDAYNASGQDLTGLMTQKKLYEFIRFRDQYPVGKKYADLQRSGVHFIPRDHSLFPERLNHLRDAPIGIFVKGSTDVVKRCDSGAVAIVGTRKPTTYGTRITTWFAAAAARAGVPVISGLAYGLDAAAHSSVLKEHGLTIAVLGSGVDSPYPSGNRMLADRIAAEGGALVSEYPLGVEAWKHHFVLRNRIIAALCHGVFVGEGALISGAMITARNAADLGREVLVAPMPLDSKLSEGPNYLAAHGATVVYSPEDILRAIGLDSLVSEIKPNSVGAYVRADEHDRILQNLKIESMSISLLSQRCGMDPASVTRALTALELSGTVVRRNGVYSVAACGINRHV